ncbi:MAG: hypothetical protein IJR72_01855 [Oscillospiraceae bacterium]|nr:hypothetical protein [Oscillospiraceae bacterium]
MNEHQTPAPQAQGVSAPLAEPVTVTAAQAEPVPVPGTVPQNAATVPANTAQAVSVPSPAAQPGSVPTAAGTVPANPAPVATEPDYRALYENLRRENEILRHNAEVTRHAPVQGVSGGGTVAAPVDDFIRGFDSDTWD